jgi:hypothetical protein
MFVPPRTTQKRSEGLTAPPSGNDEIFAVAIYLRGVFFSKVTR